MQISLFYEAAKKFTQMVFIFGIRYLHVEGHVYVNKFYLYLELDTTEKLGFNSAI